MMAILISNPELLLTVAAGNCTEHHNRRRAAFNHSRSHYIFLLLSVTHHVSVLWDSVRHYSETENETHSAKLSDQNCC